VKQGLRVAIRIFSSPSSETSIVSLLQYEQNKDDTLFF
jgi:hypothetical protein